jgi:hypothetical protein
MLKIANGHHRVRDLVLPPDQCSHARQQLGDREGLGQVVICAKIQSLDAVVDPITSGQEQDRHGLASCTHLGEDLEAGDLGQHDVEDEQVVGIMQGMPPTLLAITGCSRRRSRLHRPSAQGIA